MKAKFKPSPLIIYFMPRIYMKWIKIFLSLPLLYANASSTFYFTLYLVSLWIYMFPGYKLIMDCGKNYVLFLKSFSFSLNLIYTKQKERCYKFQLLFIFYRGIFYFSKSRNIICLFFFYTMKSNWIRVPVQPLGWASPREALHMTGWLVKIWVWLFAHVTN